MTQTEQLKALEKHNKLREILQDYGCEEWGDAIIDEISYIFDTPTTTDIADEEGTLFDFKD